MHVYICITYEQGVKWVKRAIEEMGNPFGKTNIDMLVLNSRIIEDSAVWDTKWHTERLGLDTYVNDHERLHGQSNNASFKFYYSS